MKGFRLIGCESGQIRLSGERYGLGAEGGDVDAAGEGGDVEVGKSLLFSEFFANFAHKYLRK